MYQSYFLHTMACTYLVLKKYHSDPVIPFHGTKKVKSRYNDDLVIVKNRLLHWPLAAILTIVPNSMRWKGSTTIWKRYPWNLLYGQAR